MLKRCACVQLKRATGLGISTFADSFLTSYRTIMGIFEHIFGFSGDLDEFVSTLVTSEDTILKYYMVQMWREGLADQAR